MKSVLLNKLILVVSISVTWRFGSIKVTTCFGAQKMILVGNIIYKFLRFNFSLFFEHEMYFTKSKIYLFYHFCRTRLIQKLLSQNWLQLTFNPPLLNIGCEYFNRIRIIMKRTLIYCLVNLRTNWAFHTVLSTRGYGLLKILSFKVRMVTVTH